MWTAIGGFLKVFAEKHLIPTIVSISGAIIAILYLPYDYWMIVKLGKILFLLLAFSMFFLVTKLIVFVCSKIYSCVHRIKRKEYFERSNVGNEKKNMEALWTAVDKLCPNDRDLLKEFLDSNNSPITKSSSTRYSGNSLLNSDWVVSTEEYGEDEEPAILSSNLKGKMILTNPDILSGCRTIIVKYKLREDIYLILKYSKEKYGKISHFE